MNYKITKTIAEDAAIFAVEPIQKKKNAIEKDQKEFVRSIYLESIPKDVLSFFTKHPTYTKKSGSLYLKYLGQMMWISIDSVPIESENKGFAIASIEDQNKMESFCIEIEKLESQLRKSKKEIEVALFKLGTYNRVAENLPELLAFLPERKETAIALNFDTVRETLSQIGK